VSYVLDRQVSKLLSSPPPTNVVDTTDTFSLLTGQFIFWAAVILDVDNNRTLTITDDLGWGDSAFVRISNTWDATLLTRYVFGYVQNIPSGGLQYVHFTWTGSDIVVAGVYCAAFNSIDTVLAHTSGESAVGITANPGTATDSINSGLITNLGLSFQPDLIVGFSHNFTQLVQTVGAPDPGTGFSAGEDNYGYDGLTWNGTGRMFLGRTTQQAQVKATATPTAGYDSDTYVTFCGVFREDAPGPPSGPQPVFQMNMP
jgi:hypothetical protein